MHGRKLYIPTSGETAKCSKSKNILWGTGSFWLGGAMTFDRLDPCLKINTWQNFTEEKEGKEANLNNLGERCFNWKL